MIGFLQKNKPKNSIVKNHVVLALDNPIGRVSRLFKDPQHYGISSPDTFILSLLHKLENPIYQSTCIFEAYF